MGYKREGVFVDMGEAKRLQDLYVTMSEPVFGLTTKLAFAQEKRVIDAGRDYYAGVNAAAVALGLPEPEADGDGDLNNYGIDFRNGEIISVPNA